MRKTARAFWRRLHLWLAFITATPLLVIAATGVLLAYQPWLERWLEPQHFDVQPTGEAMSTAAAVTALGGYAPGTQLHYVGVPEPGAARPYRAFASTPNPAGDRDRFNLFLDPYTGEVTRRTEPGPVRFIVSLHRNLTAGQVGRYLVGGSSLVLMVSSLVGIYLWWPMRQSTMRRLRRQSDSLSWHNLLGLAVLPLTFLLAFTGITLTFMDQVMPAVRWVTLSPKPPPAPTIEPVANPDLTLTDVIRTVETRYPDTSISALGDRGGEEDPFALWLRRSDEMHPNGWERVYIHPETGETVALVDKFSQSPASAYQRSWFTWHTGQMLGLPGRILWSLASAGLFAITVTGFALWWRRRRARYTKRRPAASSAEQVPA